MEIHKKQHNQKDILRPLNPQGGTTVMITVIINYDYSD